jgi:hypothetical protein
MFSLQHNWRRREQNRFCLEAGGWGRRREVAQRMYTHVSKCKNDKNKRRGKNMIYIHNGFLLSHKEE